MLMSSDYVVSLNMLDEVVLVNLAFPWHPFPHETLGDSS